ncbi:MAG TPA: YdcF family protein [Thermoanaerobaculia bacterium]
MQNERVLSAGKAFTDPLFVLLVAAIVSLLFTMRHRAARRPAALALIALLILAALSTAVVASALVRSLEVDAPAGQAAPEVIVIAAGGSSPDVLSLSSESRLREGVAWWREHPRARLVMAGADLIPGGTSPRTVRLMREAAIRAGVPPSRIELEVRSTNTREHPTGLLRLPGITRNTRVGVVTSSWHMRRTLREFRRHFANPIAHPTRRAPAEPFVVNDVLPSSRELWLSTVMLHEWIGLAWYALRR